MSSAITTDPLDLIELDTSSSRKVLTDIGKTKISSNSQVDGAIPTQLAQWVYIQTPPKMSTTSSLLNKNNPTNIVVNQSSLHLPNLGSNITHKTMSMSSNQNVILAQHPVKQQHLYIQKQSSNSGSKNTLTYLTMIKPQNMSISTQNQKYVIAPMPKLTSNRLPSTVTTNSVKPKLALMPLTLQNTISKPPIPKHKVFNLKIADGQLQTNSSGAITVLCEDKSDLRPTYYKSQETHSDQHRLIRNELANNSKKESVIDKSYELSIVEDSSSKNDVSFTITIPDENDKTKPQQFRDVHKFSKHGVSILKKNLNLDQKPEKKFSISSNSITTISDCNTKEVKISTVNSFNVEEPLITIENKAFHKTERRRKSNVACRKEYDEVVIMQNLGEITKPPENTKIGNMDEVEIKILKEGPDISEVKRILTWDDGVGTLPGSDIRFQINEFGMLEYLKNEEYKEILETKSKKIIKKTEVQEEMCCLACGCFGMLNEFLNPRYCSMDCEEMGAKALKQKEARLKKKKLLKKFREINSKEGKLEKDEFISEEDSTSNEYAQDKFSYPWNCTKKGFSWSKYLEHVKAKAVPVKFFKDPFPYNRNGFRPGMKLEGVDPQHPSYFCVLSVAEVIGYRLRLHFDGYSENYDFWVNADSMDIFPAGWCEKYNHTLHPPPGYTEGDFNWSSYLKQTKGTVAPKHLFANRAGSAICPNGFRVGMKLEAVDKKNTSLICVATVADMMDNRILVHFDSWDDIYDYWADPTSPYIHPVGWSDQNGHNLTPPNRKLPEPAWLYKDYLEPESFTWEKYLKETKSTAAPVRAFKQKPAYGFKRGMRLECVDKRVPQLIRVATVDDTKEHQIRISFDGWPDRYSYWVDNDSLDIHPVGWCQKTGHPIEPPLTPDDVYDFLECPTVGCRGQGHINGSKLSTHSLTTDCPYSDENMHREHVLPDRLLSPDRQLESVVPISREPKEPREKIKPKMGRPPKAVQAEPRIKNEWDCPEMDINDSKPLKRKYSKCFKSEPSEKNFKKAVPLTNGYDSAFNEQIWEKHSNYLHKYLKNNLDPREWQEDDVIDFIGSIPYSEIDYGALFKEHKIDGEALLMLNQKDLVDLLSIKLGPAIKLYNVIMLLRRSVLS